MSRSFLKLKLIVLFSLFAGSGFTWAAEQVVEVQNKTYWLCKNKKEVRTIRVSVNAAGVCTTYYSKLGEEKVVGSGKNHASCENFLANVKSNLEKSNWNCRDISASRITASVE